ncbi:hypothetical protein [Falsiroseomonas sp. CW058]|uniref:hypothetical protein n=1 Tax=Falsiroseomonas sp. CW058 TaxID=3388664 RepID=UPI003D31A1BF
MSEDQGLPFYECTDDGAAWIERYPDLYEPAWRYWISRENLAWMLLLAAETSLLKEIEEFYGESQFGERIGLEAIALSCQTEITELLTHAGEPVGRIERFLEQLRELGRQEAHWRWKELAAKKAREASRAAKAS